MTGLFLSDCHSLYGATESRVAIVLNSNAVDCRGNSIGRYIVVGAWHAQRLADAVNHESARHVISETGPSLLWTSQRL